MEKTQCKGAVCPYFKCGRNALIIKNGTPWCSFVDEPCTPRCAFAVCKRNNLLPDAQCVELRREFARRRRSRLQEPMTEAGVNLPIHLPKRLQTKLTTQRRKRLQGNK